MKVPCVKIAFIVLFYFLHTSFDSTVFPAHPLLFPPLMRNENIARVPDYENELGVREKPASLANKRRICRSLIHIKRGIEIVLKDCLFYGLFNAFPVFNVPEQDHFPRYLCYIRMSIYAVAQPARTPARKARHKNHFA